MTLGIKTTSIFLKTNIFSSKIVRNQTESLLKIIQHSIHLDHFPAEPQKFNLAATKARVNPSKALLAKN